MCISNTRNKRQKKLKYLFTIRGKIRDFKLFQWAGSYLNAVKVPRGDKWKKLISPPLFPVS